MAIARLRSCLVSARRSNYVDRSKTGPGTLDRIAGGLETVLVAGTDRSRVAGLQRELQECAKYILTSVGAEQAKNALAGGSVQLIIVAVDTENRVAEQSSAAQRAATRSRAPEASAEP